MTLRDLGEWCLSWEEDQDKNVSVSGIPRNAKVAELSISDNGTKNATVYFTGEYKKRANAANKRKADE